MYGAESLTVHKTEGNVVQGQKRKIRARYGVWRIRTNDELHGETGTLNEVKIFLVFPKNKVGWPFTNGDKKE